MSMAENHSRLLITNCCTVGWNKRKSQSWFNRTESNALLSPKRCRRLLSLGSVYRIDWNNLPDYKCIPSIDKNLPINQSAPSFNSTSFIQPLRIASMCSQSLHEDQGIFFSDKSLLGSGPGSDVWWPGLERGVCRLIGLGPGHGSSACSMFLRVLETSSLTASSADLVLSFVMGFVLGNNPAFKIPYFPIVTLPASISAVEIRSTGSGKGI